MRRLAPLLLLPFAGCAQILGIEEGVPAECVTSSLPLVGGDFTMEVSTDQGHYYFWLGVMTDYNCDETLYIYGFAKPLDPANSWMAGDHIDLAGGVVDQFGATSWPWYNYPIPAWADPIAPMADVTIDLMLDGSQYDPSYICGTAYGVSHETDGDVSFSGTFYAELIPGGGAPTGPPALNACP